MKQVKQDSHLKLLELQKAKATLQEVSFENGKLAKEMEFLKNRADTLELEK